MRIAPHLALGLIPAACLAQAPEDPQLASLIQEALARNPDAARSSAMARAEKERIPQAGALPDPVLSLGLQNDGFKKLQIGQMETSYYSIMVTQPLLWPGKRGLRGDIARMGSQAAMESLSRVRLTLEADIRRGYVALLLVRSQLRLLDQQALFLQQAETTARVRYEVGQGAQVDLLRAQLERTRLEQSRLDLQSEERATLAALNRLRALPPDAPLATERTLEQQPDPAPIRATEADGARNLSPELKAARIAVDQAGKSLELARLDRRPDFAVTAGYMPRGGFDPMWTASVSITLPVWQKRKQAQAVVEQEHRRRASGSEVESLEALIGQRVQERAAQMDAALGVLRVYRSGLLVQSETSFRATLAQYGVGKVPFLSVLEALNGWIADQSGLLQAQARAQAIAIAQRELNLGSVPPIGSTSLGGTALGGGGGAPASAGARKGAAAGSESESSSMKSM
ncbi:TolC family protein [Mesoterricola silvestris]|uniref:PTS cellobiose transporter subunit IIC n=1 Tax=Mesoterricola silvestris TaxID=2927979 RepID=A0AA48GQX0_9BACT|nr:TolC family protein [Mesoterricola silvestris]BDU74065.1 PTS cellobiose transporter subunit IIC [Mesoterricola silvestris]